MIFYLIFAIYKNISTFFNQFNKNLRKPVVSALFVVMFFILSYLAYLNNFNKNNDDFKVMGGPAENIEKNILNFDYDKDKAILKDNNKFNPGNLYLDNSLAEKGIILSANQCLEPNKKILDSKNIQNDNTTNNNGKINFIIPVNGINWGKLHPKNAVDIAASCGENVYAASNGLVTNLAKTGWNSGYGEFIEIEHLNNVKTLYAHLNSIDVSIGDYIKQGEKIGETGKTGESTGCHLHFEVNGQDNPFVR